MNRLEILGTLRNSNTRHTYFELVTIYTMNLPKLDLIAGYRKISLDG